MFKPYIICFKLLFVCFYISVSTSQAIASEFIKNILITSNDGTKISANLWLADKTSTQLTPAIVFINSWTLTEYEYAARARKLSQQGYNVISYSARGWGASEGEVNVGGPEDIEDFKSVVDWLLANTNSDENALGAAGISYGGGISLLAASFDKRIKAVASLSGWANLQNALLPGNAANILWSMLLMKSGQLTGRLPQSLIENFEYLNNYQNLLHINKWCMIRSAESYVSQMNQNNTAVLIINNWADYLFNPKSIIPYFKKLSTPKRLIYSDGIHGSSEASGLFGLNNEMWNETTSWFDKYLKTTKHRKIPSTSVLVKNRSTDDYLAYKNWPLDNTLVQKLFLSPNSNSESGNITHLIPSIAGSSEQTIASGNDSNASTGIPVLGSILDAYTPIPVFMNWDKAKTDHSFSFDTKPLKEKFKLRGSLELDLHLTSNSLSQNIYVYVYDINTWGYARLISHGPKRYIPLLAHLGLSEKISVEIFPIVYDLPKGHKLGLIIDTVDEIYAESNDENNLILNFSNSKVNELRMMVEKNIKL